MFYGSGAPTVQKQSIPATLPTWWQWQMFRWGQLKRIYTRLLVLLSVLSILGSCMLFYGAMSVDAVCERQSRVQDSDAKTGSKVSEKEQQQRVEQCRLQLVQKAVEKQTAASNPDGAIGALIKKPLGWVWTPMQQWVQVQGQKLGVSSWMLVGAPVGDGSGQRVQTNAQKAQWLLDRPLQGQFEEDTLLLKGCALIIVLAMVGLVFSGAREKDDKAKVQHYRLEQISAYRHRFYLGLVCALVGVLWHIGMALALWVVCKVVLSMQGEDFTKMKHSWRAERWWGKVWLSSCLTVGAVAFVWFISWCWGGLSAAAGAGAQFIEYFNVWMYTWRSADGWGAALWTLLWQVSGYISVRMWYEGAYMVGVLILTVVGLLGLALIAEAGTEWLERYTEGKAKGKKGSNWTAQLEQVIVEEQKPLLDALVQQSALEKSVKKGAEKSKVNSALEEGWGHEGAHQGGQSVSKLRRL